MSLYFIALVPDEDLKEKIKVLKEEMAAKFNASHALKLPAHITLQPPFKLNKKEEDLLLKELNRLRCKFSPFEVDLSGFGSFPPKVIFIHIKNLEPVRYIYNELKKGLKIIIPEEYHESREFHPHITIATKDLEKSSYKNAWSEFKARTFSAKFSATKISLFRHNGRSWKILKEFEFSL